MARSRVMPSFGCAVGGCADGGFADGGFADGGFADGGWRMADGRWRMAEGGGRMADGGWRVADGGNLGGRGHQRKPPTAKLPSAQPPTGEAATRSRLSPSRSAFPVRRRVPRDPAGR